MKEIAAAISITTAARGRICAGSTPMLRDPEIPVCKAVGEEQIRPGDDHRQPDATPFTSLSGFPDSALLQGTSQHPSQVADEAEEREEHQRDEERRSEEAKKDEVAWSGFHAQHREVHRQDECI